MVPDVGTETDQTEVVKVRERKMKLENKIAAVAREKLGRAAIKRVDRIDWPAAEAVAEAARECGLSGLLGAWVRPSRSLRGYAADYLSRYCQAYGPVGNRIDISHLVGSRSPVTLTL